MTITQGTINTTVKLTELERRAKAITNLTKEEILLKFRYRPINPTKETKYTFIYEIHQNITLEREVKKADCIIADGQVYCKNTVYNQKRYTY
jgi:hypothetical protein